MPLSSTRARRSNPRLPHGDIRTAVAALKMQHSHNAHAHGGWTDLSDELWGSIFSCLRGQLDCKRGWLNGEDVDPWDLSDFYKVASVCQKFKSIFSNNPSLFSTMRVGPMLGNDLAGMLKWVHIHCTAVETLVVLGDSPWLEAALTALMACCLVRSTPVGLRSAYFAQTSKSSLTSLRQFDSVTQVELHGSLELSLSPLQSLPHLTNLALVDGKFWALDRLAPLTSLSANGCDVDCVHNCLSVASLVNLFVIDSTLRRFHANGLSACSNLQQLHCFNVHIADHDQDGAEAMIFAGLQFAVPRSLSKLTALTSLFMSYTHDTMHVQLDWLSQLPSLQSVTLQMQVPLLTLPESISQLTQLTKLQLSNTRLNGKIEALCLWSRLNALQELSVRGAAQFDKDLCDLAQLVSLTSVEFAGMQMCNGTNMAVQVGQLGHKLGVTQSNVKFCLK